MTQADRSTVACIILAGGLARRMGGGDKPLRLLAGRPILEHVVACMLPQVTALALNANGDPARFAQFQLPVIPDGIAGHAGPLAGVLAGMEWARATFPGLRDILTVPGDTPFLPRDLARRLSLARDAAGADIAIAASGGRSHPVLGLWPVRLAETLRAALTVERVRKVEAFVARHRLATADFPVVPADPFHNVNTEDDLIQAEIIAGSARPRSS